MTSAVGGATGGGGPQKRWSYGGCMNIITWREGVCPKIQKLCGRHMCMVPHVKRNLSRVKWYSLASENCFICADWRLAWRTALQVHSKFSFCNSDRKVSLDFISRRAVTSLVRWLESDSNFATTMANPIMSAIFVRTARIPEAALSKWLTVTVSPPPPFPSFPPPRTTPHQDGNSPAKIWKSEMLRDIKKW